MEDEKSAESFTELIPGLPEEIAVHCLARLHHLAHRASTLTCRRWRDLLLGRELYHYRRQNGLTRRLACLVQARVHPGLKPVVNGVTVFDPTSWSWDRLDPVPDYPSGIPLFCRLASSEGKLIVMGGLDAVTYEPVRDVFVYEFLARRWRRGKEMPEARSFFAAGEAEGRVVVAGGHDRNKNALDTAWVYDVAGDAWRELGKMSEERDECEAVAVGAEVWVVSGYRTERQGQFEGSAEAVDLGTGQWRRVEGAWREGECPRSCAGVWRDRDRNERLESWGGCEEAVRVGACGVRLGEDGALVTGSAYEGGPTGFMVVEGQNGKKRKIKVAEDFSGYIQSGCCVEI